MEASAFTIVATFFKIFMASSWLFFEVRQEKLDTRSNVEDAMKRGY